MRSPALLFSVSSAAVLALGVWTSVSRGQGPPAACPEAGERLYDRSCLACHGHEAAGGTATWQGNRVEAPSLRGLASAPGADWDQIIDFIEEGHGAMPGWGGVINRPNIRRILEYLDSLDRPEQYAHDMEERTKKRRRDEPTECEIAAEAPGPDEDDEAPGLPAAVADEPVVEPGQEK